MIVKCKFICKITFLLVLISSCFFTLQLFSQNTETLTISTYYPAPHGVYKTLRLYPTDEINPASNCTNAGEMFYDNSENVTYVCNGSTSKWEPVGMSLWTLDGTAPNQYIYPNETSWNVGIGTTGATTKLEVAQNTAIKLGDAYVSSGNAQLAHFASNAWWNSAAWQIPDATRKSGLIQFVNDIIIFYQTQTAGDDDWRESMRITSDGVVSAVRFMVQERTGDPSTPNEGEIWIVQ